VAGHQGEPRATLPGLAASPAVIVQFNREGDRLTTKLCLGNVHNADDWEELLLPEIERQQKQGKEVVFLADAAFAKPEICEALEERGVKCAIRLPANDIWSGISRNCRAIQWEGRAVISEDGRPAAQARPVSFGCFWRRAT